MGFFLKLRIALKASAPSVFDPQDPLPSSKISEKFYEPFLRNTDYWPTDRGRFIGRGSTNKYLITLQYFQDWFFLKNIFQVFPELVQT